MLGNTTPFTLHGPHAFKGEQNLILKATLSQFPSAPAHLCTELSPLGYMPSHDIMCIIRIKALYSTNHNFLK